MKRRSVSSSILSVESENLVDNTCNLRFDIEATHRRLTSIGVTIGKKSRVPELIEQMVMEGTNLVRINFSYETHEDHLETIEMLRDAVAACTKTLGYQVHVAIAADLKGPVIRTGSFEPPINEIDLRKNDNIRLTVNPDLETKGNREAVFVDYPGIVDVVAQGTRILLDDGAIVLLVKELTADMLTCVVLVGGVLRPQRNVNLPGMALDLPPVSEKDKADLAFALENRVDVIFASKIRSADTIADLRALLGPKGHDIRIVAKIDNMQALDNVDEILAAADGLYVSRVDLGIELRQSRVLLVQKALIARCNRAGKPIICAGHMFESMLTHYKPSRAEVADLGNAILDGVDCVVLSSETAIGKFPVQVVTETSTVCREAELALFYRNLFDDLIARNPPVIDAAHAAAIAAVEAARKSLASTIIVLTTSGRSAQLIGKYRPRCPIMAVTKCWRAARQCGLCRGIIPLRFDEPPSDSWIRDIDSRVKYALVTGRKMKFVKTRDPVVVVSPWKEALGFTNNVRILYAFFEFENFECVLKTERLK